MDVDPPFAGSFDMAAARRHDALEHAPRRGLRCQPVAAIRDGKTSQVRRSHPTPCRREMYYQARTWAGWDLPPAGGENVSNREPA